MCYILRMRTILPPGLLVFSPAFETIDAACHEKVLIRTRIENKVAVMNRINDPRGTLRWSAMVHGLTRTTQTLLSISRATHQRP